MAKALGFEFGMHAPRHDCEKIFKKGRGQGQVMFKVT